ncbi:complex I NDUFA9 subunit family protein [Chitinimonas viridis]|uniref:Complex I NDUFA9 subunit family protein n=1 Tax=Chitinimonas viridis TaxID=664880 RepID=A0ABT8B6P5_9NEIS|nr:complex I NDUFA9 subunit family protein [Chitinimonas viridis]MDN3577937.1 complex I NDUFA9 subunit family protein [Chitinimonas viridis]
MPVPRNARLLVIGGTGFVGTSLAERLAARGHTVTLPTRDREKVRQNLIPLPGVEVVNANVHDAATLATLMPGHAAVINLVGILHGSPERFRHAHVALSDKIMSAMATAGIKRYLHMSALGADPAGPSHYQQSKGEAETHIRASGLDWTIFRPSLIFGPGTCFVSLFADLLKLAPCLPMGGAQARMQPVWVEDVSRAFVAALTDDALIGQSLNLVGPKVYTMAELVRLIGRAAGTPRPVLSLPDGLARLQASLLGLLPNPPLSTDNLDSLKVDSVDPAGFPAHLGWQATALEAILPLLLTQGRPRDRYLQLRRQHR